MDSWTGLFESFESTLSDTSEGYGVMHRLTAGCLILFSVVLCSPVSAQQAGIGESAPGTTVEQKFRRANSAYSEGNYSQAMESYRELITITGPSAGLYYNLGCSAMKSGYLGAAVVNFHRAHRLDPRDSDIRANLEFVRALITPEDGDDELGGAGNPFLGKLRDWIFMVRESELAMAQMIFLAMLTAGAVLLVIGVSGFSRSIARVITILGFVLLMLNSAMLGVHIYDRKYVQRAVVVQDEAEALSGPGEGNTRVLVLPEGTLVRVREQRQDWSLVSLPSGRSGWLRVESVEKI
ncbi:hypothetical protein GF340_05855 [Candidatus Peregrinibacteria bacterium]|nr:hypothetical protein [Candidatus Peregrinibacteria bacterium]